MLQTKKTILTIISFLLAGFIAFNIFSHHISDTPQKTAQKILELKKQGIIKNTTNTKNTETKNNN